MFVQSVQYCRGTFVESALKIARYAFPSHKTVSDANNPTLSTKGPALWPAKASYGQPHREKSACLDAQIASLPTTVANLVCPALPTASPAIAWLRTVQAVEQEF